MPRRKPAFPCFFCGQALPETHNAVTDVVPDRFKEYGSLRPGDGWRVCGEACPGLPRDAVVVWR